MALQLSFIDERTGIVSAEAYVNIERFMGTKYNTTILYDVYYNANTRLDLLQPIASNQIEVPQTITNLTDIYNYLKTLPEFAGAIDV